MDVQSPLSSFTKLSTVIFSIVISDRKMSLAFHVHHKSRPRALLPHTTHAVVTPSTVSADAPANTELMRTLPPCLSFMIILPPSLSAQSLAHKRRPTANPAPCRNGRLNQRDAYLPR